MGNILCTALLVGTDDVTVGEQQVGLGVTVDIAHDVAIVLVSVVLSDDGVLIPVAGFHATVIGLLAYQGTHHDSRNVVEVYCAALDEAVAHHAAAAQSSGNRSHTGDRTVGLERAVLDAEPLHSTSDVVEES